MAREPRRWYDVTKASATKAVVRIYGDIGESWWDDNAVSAASLATELDEAGPVGEIEVHLNSPGGVAWDGVSIMNQLKDHPARVTVYVDGLAASAASVVAMAGDEVVMGRGSQMMIHEGSIMSWGDAAQLRKDAAMLDSLNDSMASVYAERSGQPEAAMREVMAAETWYTAEEAVAAGLADRTASKDSADTTAADVAATLSASATARRFRFQGRAAAPAPHTPGRPAGQDTQGGAVEITDQDFAALRSKLGLPEDAAIADVLDAVDEREPAAKATATAQVPDGMKLIDAGVLDDLKARASKGEQAYATQQKQHREGLVTAALRDGKIRAADKTKWLTNLEKDPETFESVLASLEGGLIPVSELGHDEGGLDETTQPTSLEDVRKSPHYAALRGIV